MKEIYSLKVIVAIKRGHGESTSCIFLTVKYDQAIIIYQISIALYTYTKHALKAMELDT